MKGTFQIVGWKRLFYRGRGGEGGREGDEKAYLKRACDDYAHYQRRPVIKGSWRPPPGRTRSRRPRPGAERKERSVICSLFPRIRLCTLPLFHYFFMSFFLIPKKKYFLKVKKKKRHIKHANTWIQQANNEMWTLSNSTLPGWDQYAETGSRKHF